LPHLRAVKKERKLYLWDWSLCQDEAARFENLVASHLLKYCHFQEDTEGDDMSLRFLRDSIGREIDFVVLRNGKPEFAVECKSGGRSLSKNISYFAQRTAIPRFYQVHRHSDGEDSERADAKARVLPFLRLCELLKL
jgi:predicted AAA+ superfamily ATPase